jgi:NADPH:quinone reductase-like Zn-dependent oxidoreductase
MVMRAIRLDEPGGPIRLEDIPVPTPRSGEALIEVHAAALTAGERAWPRHWPATLSHEVSGVVSELADDASGPHVGEQVFGLIDFHLDGAAADYVTVPAADLAAKPAGLDHIGAASMTLAPLAAWQALVDHGHLEAGQHVLVNGAAGGVGSYAVQLARALGATVTATASADDVEFVEALGADVVVDYAAPDFMPEGTAHIAIDMVGAPPWHSLREGGIMIGIADEPSAEEARRHRVRSTFFIVDPSSWDLAELAELAEAGQLTPTASQVFDLNEADEAFRVLDHQHIRGKVVLAVR